jgi:hypothetical protein
MTVVVGYVPTDAAIRTADGRRNATGYLPMSASQAARQPEFTWSPNMTRTGSRPLLLVSRLLIVRLVGGVDIASAVDPGSCWAGPKLAYT